MTKIQVDSNGKAIMLGGKALVASEGGITPTGTLSITQNGIYDVTNYASANVSVSGGGGGGGDGSFVINVLDNYDTEETHEESLSWDPTLYDPFYPYISLRTEENWYLYVSESGNIAVCQNPYNTAILPVLHMPGIPVDIDGWISTNGPIIDRNYSGYVIERERFCYLCYGENKEVEFLGTWQEE